ncbi:hypothetical protein E0K89_010950 [Aquicoccus sp. SCR17]|nr:hypothetical protein [Carideicomes alvinocaridis]
MKILLASALLCLPLSATAKVAPENEAAPASPAIHASVYSQVQGADSGFDGLCVLPLDPEGQMVATMATADDEDTSLSLRTCSAG